MSRDFKNISNERLLKVAVMLPVGFVVLMALVVPILMLLFPSGWH